METLDDYLNSGIKEIIDSHPQVMDILNDYGIGCGACDVGTCLLKDIVSLHPISYTVVGVQGDILDQKCIQ